jgi:predicted nucleic acid-binding protein
VIVVDTSVWVDFFADRALPHVEVLGRLIDEDAGLAITDVILTEILQGLPTESAVRRVRARFSALDTLRLETLADFERAAGLYRTARRAGQTIRRTTDCLIASVCVRERLPILHADKDFDRLASCTPLRTYALE